MFILCMFILRDMKFELLWVDGKWINLRAQKAKDKIHQRVPKPAGRNSS